MATRLRRKKTTTARGWASRRARVAVACLLPVVAGVLLPSACANHDAKVELPDGAYVRMGALGLKPRKGWTTLDALACDKEVYEQIALSIALEHIKTKNASIMSETVVSIVPNDLRLDVDNCAKNDFCMLNNLTR